MAEYVLITDSACDILPEKLQEWKVELIRLPYLFTDDGKELLDNDQPMKEFYNEMRGGRVAKTSGVNENTFATVFTAFLEEGKDILYLAFSSGLSVTSANGRKAAEQLAGQYPDRKIRVVDSLCASAGQGLLVHYAIQKRAQGYSLEETAQWLVDNRQKLVHWFTVDDLDTLKRGGRVSATAAFMGSMLKIKPILHVNYEGKLIPREKVQGRKKSLKVLAEKVNELAVPREGQTLFIGHGDCREDAEYTLECLRALGFEPKEVLITAIGAIIGAHSGPGTMAVFFLGESR